MKYQHLLSTCIAAAIIATSIGGGVAYTMHLEDSHVRALSAFNLHQKFVGEAMQRSAFRQNDILPMYGSSEFNIQKSYQYRFRAVRLFHNEPTGFDVFPVGTGEATNLIMLQRLAGVGAGLQGKKVAISLSPTWFFERKRIPRDAYAGNFSLLQANEVAFSTNLSYALKHDAAQRMLNYPDTLTADPLLRFALHNLADDAWTGQLLYVASMPLGMLQTWVMRLQDQYEMFNFFKGHGTMATDATQPTSHLSWSKELYKAQTTTERRTNNNRFGFDRADWRTHFAREAKYHHNIWSRNQFLDNMANTDEWNDFEMLLRELHELGAKPLVLSMPIAGRYYDYAGVTRAERQVYYDRVERLAASYGAEVQTFQKHDEDNQFVLNTRSHLLPEGWVYYSEALNNFYHDRPLTDNYTPSFATKPHHQSHHE